jgi:hypothetical protein
MRSVASVEDLPEGALMTTIIVHGTFGASRRWWLNSWGERGFCSAVARGMTQVAGGHDLWHVNSIPVSKQPTLNVRGNWLYGRIGQRFSHSDGHFFWSGMDSAGEREGAGATLAYYLNTIRQLTNEPIRIIAHSHGCNVVKFASSSGALAKNVRIDRAVFLACPHFREVNMVPVDRSSLKQKPAGYKFHYKVAPNRFGRILNLYCARDKVQLSLAQSQPELFGASLRMDYAATSSRQDLDPDAARLYESREIVVADNCGETATHTVMHGAAVGYLAGAWLASGQFFPPAGRVAANDAGE